MNALAPLMAASPENAMAVTANAMATTSAPLIVLDAGHGGSEGGVTQDSLLEADYTLKLAQETAVSLQAQGLRVALTRNSPEAVSLSARIALANQNGAAAFISLHINNSFSKVSHGIRLFLAPQMSLAGSGAPLGWKTSQRDVAPRSRKLAQALAQNLVPVASRRRAIQSLPLAVFRGLAVPAVVVELGFISNPQDVEALQAPDAIKSYAQVIAQSVVSFAGLDWKVLEVEAP